tara:strand:+ start:101 stop:448 length:348 start_codon:yes stop_codon:yes gene_type:complete
MLDGEKKEENRENLPDWLGGMGEPPTRSALQTIKRAVTNNWEIPEEWKAALPRLCLRIAADDSRGDRERLRAVEILRAMQNDNLNAAQALDRVERLDSGQATERVELGPITWNPE